MSTVKGSCIICDTPELKESVNRLRDEGLGAHRILSELQGTPNLPGISALSNHITRHYKGSAGVLQGPGYCKICSDPKLKTTVSELHMSGWGLIKIGGYLGVSKGTLQKHIIHSNIQPNPPGFNGNMRAAERTPEEDIRLSRSKAAEKELQDKYKYVLNQLKIAEDKLEHIAGLNTYHGNIVIERNPKTAGKAEACALVMASDWHVGESVDPKTINHLNEYNPDIAAKRIRNFFVNALKLVKKERHDVILDKLLLWLGGDLMTGYIHDELMESNTMSPIEESVFIRDHVEAGLRYLAKEGGFKTIKVVCNHGNHGRTTLKRRVQTAANNSFEHMIYGNLQRIFQDHKTIDFVIADGYFNYVQVFDKLIRAHHGDNIGYGGGIGGVTIPLMKFIQRSNQQQHASMDIIGHYHQLTHHRHFIINGSLIGFNAYAQSIGASPERPQQAFQLIDSKRGFTVSAPILVED